ncbi:hypothetical protein [Flavobacterium sp. CS20]|uniref:hypothetical protein n=1 Tax=Flavobacterium sp. CS20 TaxID=2775246 RepID=UPI001B3A1CB2|nr:hypothetical protein [Flavobacterium sp. CS20]QTY27073.1 hypothetical protein IGB25_00205 [Flavobacterium sp. CS20]
MEIGDKVKLIDKATDNTYIILEIFYNVRNKKWAKCKNIGDNKISEHPIINLKTI